MFILNTFPGTSSFLYLHYNFLYINLFFEQPINHNQASGKTFLNVVETCIKIHKGKKYLLQMMLIWGSLNITLSLLIKALIPIVMHCKKL